MIRTINRSQIITKMKWFLDSAFGTPAPDQFIFAEVGSSNEYDKQHISGAIFLDPRLLNQCEFLIPNLATEIIIYSSSAYREMATFVARFLANRGYANIYLYLNGKEDWSENGHPMTTTLVPVENFSPSITQKAQSARNNEKLKGMDLAMYNLELSDKEKDLLVTSLEIRLHEMREELARTRDREYHKSLKNDLDCLELIQSKLRSSAELPENPFAA